MAMINIVVLEKEARSALSNLEFEQFPFALAKTLSEIAKGSMEQVRRITKKQFKLHTEFIPLGVRYLSAKKSEIKNKGIGQTEVFTMERISGFMPVHEEGGERIPGTAGSKNAPGGKDRGKSFALPGSKGPGGDIQSYDFKTSSGKIRKKWHPRTLLQDYHGRSQGGRTKGVGRGGRKGKPFVIRGKSSNVPMLVRRSSKKRYPLEVLYIFAKRAKYPPVWEFEPTVKKYVDERFQSAFQKNLAEAVRTAR